VQIVDVLNVKLVVNVVTTGP